MCEVESKQSCERPEKLKGKPEECSAEQVKECHGEVPQHSCVPQKKQRTGVGETGRKA